MKLRRQPIIAAAAVVVVAGILFAIIHSSKKDKAETEAASATPTEQPLNISIMLDLSDRLTKPGPNGNVPQIEKDTALIAFIRQWFVDRQVRNKFMSGDMIRVMCYPNPNLADMVRIQDSLTVDMTLGSGSKLEAIRSNKRTLLSMPAVWHRSLDRLYTSALSAKQWVGADVWGYFNSSAKNQCIKQGYRNILIVLTDGYLYHKQSWRKDADGSYTGILPITVASQKSITPITADMSGLEVLFLEVNPQKPDHFSKMQALLTDWCQNMGISHVEVLVTDLPANITPSIKAFLE